jgi:DeoR family transcriptional regulator, aga operon transcriptional repressor
MVSNNQERLMAEERRRKILDLMEAQGRVTVADLVRKLKTSAVTVRADLDILAKSGALLRSRGGALRIERSTPDYPIAVRAALQRAEKQRIARAAVEMIRPHQTIALDAGSTTMEIARRLRVVRLHPLTIITNALNLAMELADLPQVSVVLPGGILRPTTYSMIGPQAERTLRELSADHAFIGVDGLDPSYGLCTTDIFDAQLDVLLIRISREVTVVTDSTKLGRRSLAIIDRVEATHRLITDTNADPAIVEDIRSRGVTVQLV